MLRVLPLAAATAAAAAPAPPPPAHPQLQRVLQQLADEESVRYNCSVAIAWRSAAARAEAAAGTADFATGRRAAPSDPYVWGSVTKVLTGASIMRLAADGLLHLDDAIPQYIDPFLVRARARSQGRQNYSSLAELYGPGVGNVTVRQLLAMHSGIEDFDTANPCPPDPPQPCTPTDQLRAMVYADPSRAFSPAELLQLPWVATRDTVAGTGHYSSTNFVLLGAILASLRGADDWDGLDQGSFLPASYDTSRLAFGAHGAPAELGAVPGYDRTSYNGNKMAPHDVSHLQGTLAGWTATDLIGPVDALAELYLDIYGPTYAVAPAEFIEQMPPADGDFYGLATFGLSDTTGQNGTYGRAYGHLGANYGYQSIVAYYPKMQFTLAVATNIELDTQPQPAETACLAYNRVASFLLNTTVACKPSKTGNWRAPGGCTCDAPLGPDQ